MICTLSIYLENFQSNQDVIYNFSSSVSKGVADSFLIYYCICDNNRINILGENIDTSLLGNVIQYTSYALILFKLISIL